MREGDIFPQLPTRQGYVLIGYNTAADGSGTLYTALPSPTTFTADTTLYAQWQPIYNITLDKDGGTGGDDGFVFMPRAGYWLYADDVLTNREISSITVPTRANYTFGGYYTGQNCSGDNIVSPSGNIRNPYWDADGDMTLYACWDPKCIPVVLDSNTDDLDYATDIQPARPTTVYLKYGTGWYSDATCTTTPITQLSRVPSTFSGQYTFQGFRKLRKSVNYTVVHSSDLDDVKLVGGDGNFLTTNAALTAYDSDDATHIMYGRWQSVSKNMPYTFQCLGGTERNGVPFYKKVEFGVSFTVPNPAEYCDAPALSESADGIVEWIQFINGPNGRHKGGDSFIWKHNLTGDVSIWVYQLPWRTMTLNKYSRLTRRTATDGTDTILQVQGSDYYAADDTTFSNPLISSGSITPPTLTGETFMGYYTGENCTGDMVIKADGTFKVPPYFPQQRELYACWDGNQVVCPAGKFVWYWNDDNPGTTCVDCHSGYYCPGGINIVGSGNVNSENSAGVVPIYSCDRGTYNPNLGATEASACVPADPGYYVDNAGSREQKACPNIDRNGFSVPTYSDKSGATACTPCPEFNDPAVSSYAYNINYSGEPHSNVNQCYVYLNDGARAANGSTSSYTCFNDSRVTGKPENTYGTQAVCDTRADRVICYSGYYIDHTTFNNNHNNDTKTLRYANRQTLLDTLCVPVGEGYWSADGETGRTQCPANLTTIGYGLGADEADDCGRKLHIGDQVMYLRSSPHSTPSLRVKTKIGDVERVFYGNLNKDVGNSCMPGQNMKVRHNNTDWCLVDDASRVVTINSPDEIL